MKRISTLGIALLLFTACSKEKGSADTEKSRTEFVSSCIDGAKQQAAQNGVPLDEALIDKFCNCSADKVLSELSEQDMIKLGMQDQDMMARVQELSMSCLDEFLEGLQNQMINEYMDQPVE